MNRSALTPSLPRWPAIVLGLVILCGLPAAGMVVGFCLGGLVGPRLFGSHGYDDYNYLFGGAGLGILAGLAGAIPALWLLPTRRKLLLVVAGALTTGVVAGATWLKVVRFGGW